MLAGFNEENFYAVWDRPQVSQAAKSSGVVASGIDAMTNPKAIAIPIIQAQRGWGNDSGQRFAFIKKAR